MRKVKAIICALLSVCIFACPFAASVAVTGAEDINSLESQLEQLNKDSAKYQKTLDDTQTDINEKEKYSDALVGKIETLGKKITVTNQAISKLNTDIGEKQKLIDQGNKDIEKQLDALCGRLKAIYKAGSASDLEIVLGAKDLSDFIDKVNLVKNVSAIDRELIDGINEKLTVVNKQKKELENDKAKLDKDKKDLQNDRTDLNTTLEKNENLLKDLYTENTNAQSKLNGVKGQYTELEKQIAAYWEADRKAKAAASSTGSADVSEQVQRVEKRRQASHQQSSSSQSSSGGSASRSSSASSSQQSSQQQSYYEEEPEPTPTPVYSDGYVWPCPGFYYLSSLFGEDRTSYAHGAIDIAGGGIMGATVVAAADGYVSSTCTYCTHNWGKSGSCGCGGGFGNYVWIDHENGKESIYAHLTSVVVNPGQYVTAGQVIGYVGTTGYSTGPHLHFECRYNGVKYDPMSEFE